MIKHCFLLCYNVITTVLFLDTARRKFLPGLEKKYIGNADMAMGTGYCQMKEGFNNGEHACRLCPDQYIVAGGFLAVALRIIRKKNNLDVWHNLNSSSVHLQDIVSHINILSNLTNYAMLILQNVFSNLYLEDIKRKIFFYSVQGC